MKDSRHARLINAMADKGWIWKEDWQGTCIAFDGYLIGLPDKYFANWTEVRKYVNN